MKNWSMAIMASMCFCGPAMGDVADTFDELHTARPGPGEAAVYFVRPAKMGFAINFWAFVDEQPVGVTKGGTYTWAVVPAGEHVIWSRSGNVSALRTTLEPGRSYYFEQKVRMGGVRARVALEPMDEAEALAAMEKGKYSKLTEEGVAEGAEHSSKDYAEALEAAGE